MKAILFYLCLLFLVALGSCSEGRADKDLKPFDTTNQTHDIDTFRNKHIIYDNP